MNKKLIIKISCFALAAVVLFVSVLLLQKNLSIENYDYLFEEITMQSVWAKNYSKEKNISIAFRAKVNAGSLTVKVAASTTYQVYVNDTFLAYGPMRSAHGYSNAVDYPFSSALSEAYITVIVASYNINTYYTVLEDPFFACEVQDENGKTLLQTADFSGYLLHDRIKKVAKYSFQRPFTESYDFSKDRKNFLCGEESYAKVTLTKVSSNKLKKSTLTNPLFDKIALNNVIESGKTSVRNDNFVYDSDLFYQKDSENAAGYKKSEIESDLLTEGCKLKFTQGIGEGDTENRYDLYELPLNATGFVGLDISAASDSEIYILFDEIIYDEIKNDANLGKYYSGSEKPLVFWRGNTGNVVKWKLKAGNYNLLTFEPYTMKYLSIAVLGNAEISPSFITYENSSVSLEFYTENEDITKIFNAAENSFKQNAVDVLTDCPSRERAGWLCDSYFTARSERFFTGDNKVERNMLLSYLLSPQSEYLPDGMLPMCYPADHYNGNYIANWSLWLIVQLQDYLKRTGDSELTQAFKTKIYNLLDCMEKFENSDGLLERVDKWVFIEWSKANEFTMDVNYPSNMLYSGALRAAAEIYSDEKLLNKSLEVKQKILDQSFNGEFFIDNAVRNNGKLVLTENTSETCQYYAFYFNIADQESLPALYNTMFNVIKPDRAADVYPKLYKSNAFIGNYLRLDFLAREGKYSQLIGECGDYFLYMAERTQTLWEHDSVSASCNHGFASLVAEWIVKAYSGFSHVDRETKTIYFNNPYIEEDCSGKIPYNEVFIGFEVKNGSLTVEPPKGYSVVIG